MDLFFRKYLAKKDQYRFWLAIIFLLLFFVLIGTVVVGIIFKIDLHTAWKDILLVIIGAVVGNIGKIFDFFFNSLDVDNKLIDKVDEEDDHLQGGSKQLLD
jgi:hypothetical protein